VKRLAELQVEQKEMYAAILTDMEQKKDEALMSCQKKQTLINVWSSRNECALILFYLVAHWTSFRDVHVHRSQKLNTTKHQDCFTDKNYF